MPIGVSLALLGLLYLLLYRRFRAYEIDNPWYLSFSRSFWADRVGSDVFLKCVFPNGMGGTTVFGRGPALIQGVFLAPFGWQPIPALLLSTAVVLAGLRVWYGFLRNSGFSVTQSSACVLGLGLLEPFVDMADRFRYEPFGFLLMAVAFRLASSRRPVLALTVALLALETEPAAIMVSLALALYLVRSGCRWRTLLAAGATAAVCFAAAYSVLHPGIVGTLQATDWHTGAYQRETGGFLRAYFIRRQRHLVELVLLSVCAGWLGWRYRDVPAPIRRMMEVAGLLTLCSFLMNWPTPAYMVFWYPAVLVAAMWCVTSRGWSAWVLPSVLALVTLPQYAALAWINRSDGYTADDLARVREAIGRSEREAGVDDAMVRIMGDYSLWFAHPARYQALGVTTLDAAADKDIFLCFDGLLRPTQMVDPMARYCSDLSPRVATREVEQITVRGHLLHVLVRQRGSAGAQR